MFATTSQLLDDLNLRALQELPSLQEIGALLEQEYDCAGIKAVPAMKAILSRDNPFYKELARLSGSARQRSKSNQTLLDGAHLLAAYLDSGNQPRHILLNAAALHDDEIAGLLQQVRDVPVTQLDDKLFAGLSELKTPSGILALIEIPQPAALV